MPSTRARSRADPRSGDSPLEGRGTIGKPLNQITFADIDQFVQEKWPEGKTVDYKRDAYGNQHEDIKALACSARPWCLSMVLLSPKSGLGTS
jgi:hypothetical protein